MLLTRWQIDSGIEAVIGTSSGQSSCDTRDCLAKSHGNDKLSVVADNGRVVIPAALQTALGIAGQRAEVFFDLRGDHVTITTRMRELRKAQDRIARIAQTGAKLASDELIEDRRAEARRESDDA